MKAADPKAVGKAFTAPIVESALASYPGMFPTAPPAEGTPYGVYWPTTVAGGLVTQTVHLGDRVEPQAPAPSAALVLDEVTHAPLGTFVGARSGDKGGDANVGLWVRASGDAELDDERAAWLRAFVTAERVHALLPEAADLAVDVHPLDNLRAVNVVVHGLLGRGVADSTSLDPQAKGLGEHVRARVVEIPTSLLPDVGAAT